MHMNVRFTLTVKCAHVLKEFLYEIAKEINKDTD